MKCTVIGIAGGTGSGKSTFTARIKAAFPDKVAVLYHDNYYKAHDNIPFEERKTINYDHPNSLETNLLIEHVKLLKNGKAVDAPTYDFTQHGCFYSERMFMPDRTYFLTPELTEPGERRATFLVSKQMFIPDVTPFFLSKHYISTRRK